MSDEKKPLRTPEAQMCNGLGLCVKSGANPTASPETMCDGAGRCLKAMVSVSAPPVCRLCGERDTQLQDGPACADEGACFERRHPRSGTAEAQHGEYRLTEANVANFRKRVEACIAGGAGTFAPEDMLLLIASHETLQPLRTKNTDPACTCCPPDVQDEACPLHGRDLREVVDLYRKCQADLVEARIQIDKLRDYAQAIRARTWSYEDGVIHVHVHATMKGTIGAIKCVVNVDGPRQGPRER